ncbi:MAG: class I SAM-dependent methyltransferase [Agrobacterium albertimagni]|uniref:Methyltransferase n=1 Tax=Agrobacterium albertimagni AOL15 TaxID=1156935 RepID=K2Q5E2_9HYPH|nr:class I SAM-dependent methyltransferase [Agrobacterium albertimagni]EKF60375.1 methyltransferase [Agrobacterium albertimagni AOL15]
MPVDPAFARFDMARLYDAFNHHGEDGDFYENFPEAPCRVLDIGCGTGSVPLRLARRGHRVTGVDPAEGMLKVARAKDEYGLVDWVQATASTFERPARFDLAIMTGHVFQVFPDDAETLAALRNIHRHMAPGGKLILESRNPLDRAWEGWTREKTHEQRVIDGIGPVDVYYQIKDVEGEHVTFDAVFTIEATGEILLSVSRLRFPPAEAIERLLRTAGFTEVDLLGWWDRSPYSETSPEIIAIARA